MQHKVTAQIGAHSISIETGKIAKLADGSVIVSCGETIVLASAVSATTSSPSRLITGKKLRPRENFPAVILNAKDARRKRKPSRRG